jgi:dienelactone hydrolase
LNPGPQFFVVFLGSGSMPRLFALVALALVLPVSLRAEDRKALPPTEAKAALLKLLDRPKVPPEVKTEAEPIEKNGLTYRRWSFASEKKADGAIERVPVLTVAPAARTGKLPAIIVLHGTGGSKDGVLSWLEEFARQGIEAIAIDARYHGARSGGKKGSAAYVAAITKAWNDPAEIMEHPFYYDTVWDLWRLVDLLEEKSAKRKIGMTGISMGGIETWLAASVDDRVSVAAPLIAVQSFRWSLENDKWQGRANTIKAAHEAAAKDLGEPMVNRKVCRELWSKVIPGMLDDFDCPNLIRLFAGRALFIANGDQDGNCPIDGARLAFRAAEEAFAKSGDQAKLVIQVGEKVGHTVTPPQRQAALAFCVKWLKN